MLATKVVPVAVRLDKIEAFLDQRFGWRETEEEKQNRKKSIGKRGTNMLANIKKGLLGKITNSGAASPSRLTGLFKSPLKRSECERDSSQEKNTNEKSKEGAEEKERKGYVVDTKDKPQDPGKINELIRKEQQALKLK